MKLTLNVEIVRVAGDWPEAGLDLLIAEVARTAYGLGSCGKAGEAAAVTIVLSSDQEVQGLNRRFRGKDKPTNVLSFPATADGIAPGQEERSIGDVILAGETVAREAEELAIPFAHHAAHLVAHGTLHLLGFDHGDEVAAERMESLERRTLAAHGIGDPYEAHERLSEKVVMAGHV